MLVVPEQEAAEVLHDPFRGPQLNAIVPIGVPPGNPRTFPIAVRRSVVENVSPASPGGGCGCLYVTSCTSETLKMTCRDSAAAAGKAAIEPATTSTTVTSRNRILNGSQTGLEEGPTGSRMTA